MHNHFAAVVVEFDPTTYTVTESEGAVVMFQIVKRTMTTQPVSVFFSTSPGTATGNRSFPGMLCKIIFLCCVDHWLAACFCQQVK